MGFFQLLWQIFRCQGVEKVYSLDIDQEPLLANVTTSTDNTGVAIGVAPLGFGRSLMEDQIRILNEDMNRQARSLFGLPAAGFNREILNVLGKDAVMPSSTNIFDATLTKDATIKDILPEAVKLEKEDITERVDLHVKNFITSKSSNHEEGDERKAQRSTMNENGLPSSMFEGLIDDERRNLARPRVPEPPSNREVRDLF